MSAISELKLPITWDADRNIFGRENLTPEQNAALDAAIAAYDPLPEAKAQACVRIRDFCQRYIYASYSAEKQSNLNSDEAARATAPPPDPATLYSHDDFLRYHAFKSEARGICNYACGEVQSAENEAAVDAIMAELEHLYGLEV